MQAVKRVNLVGIAIGVGVLSLVAGTVAFIQLDDSVDSIEATGAQALLPEDASELAIDTVPDEPTTTLGAEDEAEAETTISVPPETVPTTAAPTTAAPTTAAPTTVKPKPKPAPPKPPVKKPDPKPAPAPEGTDGWVDAGNGVLVPPILLKIRFCESTDNYKAKNPNSSAAGGYQFTTGTWANQFGVRTADQATPAQQDQAAIKLWQSRGTQPWNASKKCWG